MKYPEFKSVYDFFNLEINNLCNTISKNDYAKTELKIIYDFTKQEFINTLKNYNFRSLAEYSNYLKYYSFFLQKVTYYYFKFNNLLEYFKIGISGSTAKLFSDVNSDLDLVITPIDFNYNSTLSDKIIISEMADFFSINIDLVEVIVNQPKYKVTEDIIDKLIVYSPKVIMLGETPEVNLNTIITINEHTLTQLFFDQLLLGFMPLPPEKTSTDIKYRKGGLRDIIFLLENIGRLNIYNKKDNIDKKLVEIQLNSIRNYLFMKKSHSANNLSIDDIEWRFKQNKEHKVELVRYFLHKHTKIPFSFFNELIQRHNSKVYFSIKENKTILNSSIYFPLEMLILSLTKNAYKIAESQNKFSPRLAYSLVANQHTPSEILDKLASMKGYEWRNIRDQVLKHKNISKKTIKLFVDDEIEFTRIRAKSLIK